MLKRFGATNLFVREWGSKISGILVFVLLFSLLLPTVAHGTSVPMKDMDDFRAWEQSQNPIYQERSNGADSDPSENNTAGIYDNASTAAQWKTAMPTVTGSVYTNGIALKGTAERSLQNGWTTVSLSKMNGTQLEGAMVSADGTFIISPKLYNSNVTLAAGEQLYLTAQAYGKQKSDPVKLTVQATNGQTDIPTVGHSVYEDSNSIYGLAEPGALMLAKTTISGNIGTATASTYDGSYNIGLSRQLQAGEELLLTATILGQATSSPLAIVVQGAPKTAMPTVTGNVYTNALEIKGATDGSPQDTSTTVTLTKTDGTPLASFNTQDGNYAIGPAMHNSDITLAEGEELYLTAQAHGKRPSDPAKLTVRATRGQTNVPTITGSVYDATYSIAGYAEPDAMLQLTSRDGDIIGTANANAYDGSYDLALYRQLSLGEELTLTATALGKETSKPLSVVVLGTSKTLKPTVTGNVYANGLASLKGTAELSPQYRSTNVTLSKVDGTIVAAVGANPESGIYEIGPYSYNSDIILAVGEELNLTAKAYGKDRSEPVKIVVQATQGQTQVPTVNGSVYDVPYFISGYAEPDAVMVLKRSAGGSPATVVTATYNGYFNLYYGQFHAGEEVTLTATVLGKATSNPLSLVVQPAPEMAMPTVTGSVYTNGVFLKGSTESSMQHGANVYLFKQDGTHLTSSYVRTDGSFDMISVFTDPSIALTVGEEVYLTAQSYGKKPSDPVQLTVQPAQGQTNVPTVNGSVYETTNYINGYAEPGALVVFKKDNGYPATATAATYDGYYSLYSGQLAVGERLTLTATVPGKATSNPLTITVQAAPKTAMPTVTGNVYTNGVALKGITERSNPHSAIVTLSKQDGTYLASSGAAYDGSFNINSIFTSSNVMLAVGEEVHLTAQAYGKKPSDPVKLIVQPVQGQTRVPTVNGNVYETISYFSGYAEPGALVVFKKDNGYTTTVTASTYDGYYSLYSGQLAVGEKLTLTATVPGKATSNPLTIIVQATPKTAMPTVTGNVYTNGASLNGTAESSIYYGTNVALSKKDGTYLTNSGVNYDGSFNIHWILTDSNAVLTVGEEVYLTAQANGKKPSDPVKLIVQAIQGQTKVPTVSGSVYETSTYISGYAEPGALVVLKKDNGYTMTTTAATYGGYYTLYNYGQFAAGEKITLTATAPGKATSSPLTVTVQATPKTAMPTVTGNVYTNGIALSGRVALSNPYSAGVTLSKRDGTYVTSSGVSYDGTFNMNWNFTGSSMTLIAGEELYLAAQEYGKKPSDPVKLVVQETQGQTKVPTVIGSVYEYSNFISGYAEPGAAVMFKNEHGYTMTTTAATYGGYYSFYYYGQLVMGEKLTITATAIGKATSNPLSITVLSAYKTIMPTVSGSVYTNGVALTGTAELSQQGTVVTLAKMDGAYVTSTSADQDGTFSLDLDLTGSGIILTAGEELYVTAQVYGKSKSDPVKVIVQAVEGQTAPVAADIVNEMLISGWAPFGSKVTIKNSMNGKVVAIAEPFADSYFIVNRPGSTKVGDRLTMTAAFIGQASSEPTEATVQASPPTTAPSVVGSVYSSGVMNLTGKTEAESAHKWTEVTLSRKDGTYLHGFAVTPDGNFSSYGLMNNTSVQLVAGEELLLTAQALGKRKSDPVPLIVQGTGGQTAAPVITAATESLIGGTAEPGAMIAIKSGSSGFNEVIYASGDDGSFSLGIIPEGALKAGDQLAITAAAPGKAPSNPVYALVQKSGKTAVPVVTGYIYNNGYKLNGTAEAGSGHTTITLTKADGTYVSTFGVGRDGKFSASGLFDSNVTLIEGEKLFARAQAYDRNPSDPVEFVVQAASGQTAMPSYDELRPEAPFLTGKAEPSAIVTLKNESSGYKKSITASIFDGSYFILFPSYLYKAGDHVTLNATILGKATSENVHFTIAN